MRQGLLSQQPCEKILGEVLCVLRIGAAPADVGIKGIPIGLAQAAEGLLSAGCLGVAGGQDYGPMSRGEDWSVRLSRVGILVSAFGKVWHNSLLQYDDRKTMIDECQFNSDRRASLLEYLSRCFEIARAGTTIPTCQRTLFSTVISGSK